MLKSVLSFIAEGETLDRTSCTFMSPRSCSRSDRIIGCCTHRNEVASCIGTFSKISVAPVLRMTAMLPGSGNSVQNASEWS